MKQSCKNWIDLTPYFNCTLIAASEGPKTLQEVGNLFGLTRMRICQVEKELMERIKKTAK
jgi:DNA-directed RNA polymerase sigma subunit (sigma70/sigma32)